METREQKGHELAAQAGIVHPEPEQRRGRPRLSLSDIIFSSTDKVYSTVSGRRFATYLREARVATMIALMYILVTLANWLGDRINHRRVAL